MFTKASTVLECSNFQKIPQVLLRHDRLLYACTQNVVAKMKLYLYLHPSGVAEIEGLKAVVSCDLRLEEKGSDCGLSVKMGDWGTIRHLKVLGEGSKLWQSIFMAVVTHFLR